MKESNQQSKKDRGNWVINLSQKPFTESERSILEKGPKFAMAPTKIPYKNIVAEIEASIAGLPDESKDIIGTNAASILDRARIPTHKNVTASEKKALKDLKSDKTRIIMKADKGNSFVVMDRNEYENKMENLLSDQTTYRVIQKPPFKKVERELH